MLSLWLFIATERSYYCCIRHCHLQCFWYCHYYHHFYHQECLVTTGRTFKDSLNITGWSSFSRAKERSEYYCHLHDIINSVINFLSYEQSWLLGDYINCLMLTFSELKKGPKTCNACQLQNQEQVLKSDTKCCFIRHSRLLKRLDQPRQQNIRP